MLLPLEGARRPSRRGHLPDPGSPSTLDHAARPGSRYDFTDDSGPRHDYFAVCSDSDVGKRRTKDDGVVRTFVHELQYPATTDAARLAAEMTKRHDAGHMSVVYATYHSIDVLHRAQKDHGLPAFDLVVSGLGGGEARSARRLQGDRARRRGVAREPPHGGGLSIEGFRRSVVRGARGYGARRARQRSQSPTTEGSALPITTRAAQFIASEMALAIRVALWRVIGPHPNQAGSQAHQRNEWTSV